MTTLFEDDNTNPPSPSLDLLDTASIKNELDNDHKSTSISTNDVVVRTASNDSFTPFASNAEQLSGNVQVVVHAVDDGSNNPSVQSSSQSNLYTVGDGQIVTANEGNGSGLTHVVEGTNQDGSRYTYYPSVQTSDANQSGGQFYVMMSPQDVIPVTGSAAPRIIAPRSQNLTTLADGTFTVEPAEEHQQPVTVQFRKVETTRSSRDERRRATHNEVERRRRDKINTWIMKLAAVVPDCQMDQSKQGTSKGGVLSKALDHIIKLRAQNDRMAETIKEQERILVENQVLRQQVEKLRQENAILQANIQLRQNTDQMEHDRKMESD